MFSKLSSLLVVSILVAGSATSAVSNRAYLHNLVVEMRKPWPENRTVNIVCHGHSVPAGYFQTPKVDTFNAYPHLLHKALKERFPNAVLNVIVTAIGGEHSESGAARFERDVLSLRPDVVTIDYGLNDRAIGLERAKAAWEKMIRAADSAGTKVILLTPTGDTTDRMDDPDSPLHRHARQIRDLARTHDVALADSFAAFERYVEEGGDVTDLMSQTNHPNRKGHDLVTAELLKWFPSN